MKFELVPHVDKNDKFLGAVRRSVAYRDGLIHRGVHAIVQNESGEYLIPRRSDSKSTWPGHYDLSLAETVKISETYAHALHRGLREELGIHEDVPISLIREKYYQEYFWEDYKIFGIIYLYLLKSGDEPRFVDREVQSAQWLTETEVTALITTSAQDCTPWLIHDWQVYLQSRV